MASGCVRGGLEWILGKISLLKEFESIGAGCPEKWLSHRVFKKCVDVALRDMV